MATRDSAFPPGTPCWVDLSTSDLDKSREFYGEVFGWTFTEPNADFGGYVNATVNDKRVAGLMAKGPEQASTPDAWSTYLSVEDIGATVGVATESGATVVVPAMEVGDLGSMAILIDPAGAFFGVWQPGSHTGFGLYNEPGGVTWDEHHSKDFAASKAFYEKVFGYQWDATSDTDEFRYYTAKVPGAEESVAGFMDSKGFLPAEVPSHWAVYISVADINASWEKALSLGATEVRGPENTPFGWMADLLDSTGASVKLHAPSS